MKRLSILLITLAVLAACSPTQTNSSPDATTVQDTAPAQEEIPMKNATPAPSGELAPIYAPRAGDDALQRGNAFLDSTDILTMESYPLQFAVLLKGNLPTPCHELRVAYGQPDAENKIQLEVYSVADPNAVCAQMLQPFEQTIALGSFPAGHYTVWINGKQVGEFDA
ncbi:MAG: hypothetical protein MUO77_04375 [Anaerolineales bacterium]|nr:hypothetical protein [Anaerolineales bacterium]